MGQNDPLPSKSLFVCVPLKMDIKKLNSTLLELAELAATEAAKIIIETRNGGKIEVTTKSSSADLVTQADIAAEKKILEVLTSKTPGATLFLSEEFNSATNIQDLGDEILWVIDPIDGTTNYAHGHHHSAISIAAVHHGHVQVGVVYNPFTKELFSAKKSEGAFLNGKHLNVPNWVDYDRALVATGFPVVITEELADRLSKNIATVVTQCMDIRRLGAASLDVCWVACQRIHAYYESVKPWDIAAAVLIAREAGVLISNYGSAINFSSELEKELNGDRLLVGIGGVFEFLKKEIV